MAIYSKLMFVIPVKRVKIGKEREQPNNTRILPGQLTDILHLSIELNNKSVPVPFPIPSTALVEARIAVGVLGSSHYVCSGGPFWTNKRQNCLCFLVLAQRTVNVIDSEDQVTADLAGRYSSA